MFKKLIIAFVLLISFNAFSAQTNIDTSGLSDAQVAELKAHAAKIVADTATQASGGNITQNPSAALTIAATWGTQAAQAAEGFARAFSIAARELGVTVNDFLNTDAGKLTAALIIWKVAGAALTHLMFGCVFFIVGMSIVRVIYTRLFTAEFRSVEYSWLGGFFMGTKIIRVPKGFSGFKTEGEWLAFWIMIISTGATLLFTMLIIL